LPRCQGNTRKNQKQVQPSASAFTTGKRGKPHLRSTSVASILPPFIQA
jgi:hypothetical protein